MLLDNRKFLELLFTDEFYFITNEQFKDAATGRTKSKEVRHPETGVYKGRLSKETIRPTETNGLSEVQQTLKLFTYPEITIPAGSKVTITSNEITNTYEQSGEPAVYKSHREVPIELWRVKA